MTIRGVIAASDPHTAAAGAQMLRNGGNAVDAVVAAKFAASVVELPLTSLAGGGACVWGNADLGYQVLDFFAATPGLGLATRHTLDFAPIAVDFGQTHQIFHIGKAAAAVPGQLVGLLELHRQGGRLPLRAVVRPAASWARDGFAVSPQIASIITLIAPIARCSASAARLFLAGQRFPVAGDRLSNPELGDFLHALGEEDPARLVTAYGAALVEHFGPTHGGLLTAADVETYLPVVREPLSIPFGAYTVLGNPPPSAGGGLIGVGLRIAQGRDMGQEDFLSLAHQRAVAALLATVSAWRLAGYDQRLQADPESIRELLAGTEILDRIISPSAANGENPLGATTHISVLDGEGMVAAMTTSNGEGCGHVLPGFGIHVNNFLGEEDINPAGFHQAPAGIRMSTMMSPTVVLRDGQPCFALGSGGSNRIRSAILQVLLNLLAYGLPLDAAVNAARQHVEGNRLWFEDFSLQAEVANALLADWPGATRFAAPNLFFGGVNCVAHCGGTLSGAGDRRRGGVVVVVED